MGLQAALDREAPGHMVVEIVGSVCHFLFAVALIGGGIGVLWLSQIARYGTYLLCVAILAVNCASTTYQAAVISPINERVMAAEMRQMQAKGGQPMPFDMGGLMLGGRIIGIIIALAIPVVFCAPIVILLSVKSARDGFAGRLPPDPYEEGRRPRYADYDDDDDYARSRPPQSPGDTGIKE
jgi:hypothetical protein